MNNVNRTRNKAVTIRMTSSEYDYLQSKIRESGLSQQSYIINAIHGARVPSSDELAVLKDVSRTFADLEKQLRGVATNVNQIAHVANGQGVIPSEEELKKISAQLGDYRKESEDVWRSIRLSINRQFQLVYHRNQLFY